MKQRQQSSGIQGARKRVIAKRINRVISACIFFNKWTLFIKITISHCVRLLCISVWELNFVLRIERRAYV